MRLFINVDHVATVRQARMTDEPDPVRAAVLAELGGADGITVHLREDRRHIQDRDVDLLVQTVRSGINFEMAAVPEMVNMAIRLSPMQVTLVPEKREEVTTEGGLAVLGENRALIADAVEALVGAAIRTSLFVDPDEDVIRASADMGVHAIELHTGEYANTNGAERAEQLDRLRNAAGFAQSRGLAVHAGHGLTYLNVGPVAAIPQIEELNIGHSIIAHALFAGMEGAVREMKEIVRAARARI